MNIRKTLTILRKMGREIATCQRATIHHTKLSHEERDAELARLLEQATAIAVAVRTLKEVRA